MNLSFSLGKIPVRILPSFFVTTVIINLGLAETDLARFALWLVIVAGSVLVHELGHAATGLAFGLRPRIDLHGFGGTTSWAATSRLPPSRRILVSLAGPGMGFAAGLLIALFIGVIGPGFWFVGLALPAGFGFGSPFPDRSLTEFAYERLLFVNVGWGALNLLPILPLDGGDVLAQILAGAGRGPRPARIVSLTLALIATAGALGVGWWWPALLAGSFAATNWRDLREIRAREQATSAAAARAETTGQF